MWLGIDLGTSAVKVVVIGEDGAVVASASAPLAIQRPQPLWSEQDPSAWWAATVDAVTALPAAVRAGVRGIGLAGQMHGAVVLDAADAVLRPAMLWNDGRAWAECAVLEAAVPGLRQITGNRAMPGFTAPKLAWLRAHEPEVFASIARVLLPKDWLRLRMSGEAVSEMSDASGTLWVDVGARAWAAAMLDACGLTTVHMPRLVEGSDPAGTLTREAAATLGLSPGRPIAGGGGDNAASAVGLGVIAPGDGLVSLGTSGVVFVVSDGFAPNPARAVHAFAHALPGRWHQMAVILSAGAALAWGARAFGFADVGAALASAEALPDNAPLPVFLPYLSGERTPHDDAGATGAFHGLTHDHGPAHLMRSVTEGVAFALADGADALREAGTSVARLWLTGGGARSPLMSRLLATALDVTIDHAAGAETGPAEGAARLARMAVTREPPEMVCTKPAARSSQAPDPALAHLIAPRRAAFIALYPKLRSLRP